MSPIQEKALGVILIVCLCGVLFCRAVASQAKGEGVFKGGRRYPFVMIRSADRASFEAMLGVWRALAWMFGIVAGIDAVAWITWTALDP